MKKILIVLMMIFTIQVASVSAMQPIEPPFGVRLQIDNCKSYDTYDVNVYVKRGEVPLDFISDDLPDDVWVNVEDLNYIQTDSWDCYYIFDEWGDLFGHGQLSSFRVEVFHNGDLVDEVKQYNESITLGQDFFENNTYYLIHVNTASESFTLEEIEFDTNPMNGFEALAKLFGFIFIAIIMIALAGIMTVVEVIISSSRARRSEVPLAIIAFNVVIFGGYLTGIIVGTLNGYIILTGLALGLLGFKLYLAARNNERVMKLHVFSTIFYVLVMALMFWIASGTGFLDF